MEPREYNAVSNEPVPGQEHFSFSISDPDVTKLVLVSVYDRRTGYTVRTALPNNGVPTASIMAYAGTRWSRSDLTAYELFEEINSFGRDPRRSLATIARKYGHASVADMAMLFGYIENIPDLYAPKIFNESRVGAGQHRSTRYQDFSNAAVVDLSEYVDVLDIDPDKYKRINLIYRSLQEMALKHYVNHKDILLDAYTDFYQVDRSVPTQESALSARVFDSARYHLLSGVSTKTSMAYITSAREWARIISVLKANPDRNMRCLGEQVEILFAPEESFSDKIGYVPEASDLIRYTQADETTSSNLTSLKSHLDSKYNFNQIMVRDECPNQFIGIEVELLDQNIDAGLKALMHYVQSIYPTVDPYWLVSWIESLADEDVDEITGIAFNGFNHHKQMGVQARVNALSYFTSLSIAEMRDLNRQRALGVFVPYFSTEYNFPDLVKTGYTLPAYLTDVEEFEEQRDAFEMDLLSYYSQLEEFLGDALKEDWFPQYIIPQLLPFGHRVSTYFHGSVKELSYATNLRVRPGGHINYRIAAWLMAEEVAKNNRYLKPLRLGESRKPNAASREEFLDRS